MEGNDKMTSLKEEKRGTGKKNERKKQEKIGSELASSANGVNLVDPHVVDVSIRPLVI